MNDDPGYAGVMARLRAHLSARGARVDARELARWAPIAPARVWHRALSTLERGTTWQGEVLLSRIGVPGEAAHRFWAHVRRVGQSAALATERGTVEQTRGKQIEIALEDLLAALFALGEEQMSGAAARDRVLREAAAEKAQVKRADALLQVEYPEPADDGEGLGGMDDDGDWVDGSDAEDDAAEDPGQAVGGPDACDPSPESASAATLEAVVGAVRRELSRESKVLQDLLAVPERVHARMQSLASLHPKLKGHETVTALFAQALVQMDQRKAISAAQDPADTSGRALPYFKAFERLVRAELAPLVAPLAVPRHRDGPQRCTAQRAKLSELADLLRQAATSLDPTSRPLLPPASHAEQQGTSGSTFMLPAGAASRLRSAGLQSAPRCQWLAAAIDHVRLVIRNGYVHEDLAGEALLDHCDRLFGLERQDALLAFFLDTGRPTPAPAVQTLLLQALDFRARSLAAGRISLRAGSTDDSAGAQDAIELDALPPLPANAPAWLSGTVERSNASRADGRSALAFSWSARSSSAATSWNDLGSIQSREGARIDFHGATSGVLLRYRLQSVSPTAPAVRIHAMPAAMDAWSRHQATLRTVLGSDQGGGLPAEG